MSRYKIPRQKMDFYSKYMRFSALFMGISFFCRCLFFYGLKDISSFAGAGVFLNLTLPLLICGVYIAMTAVIHYNVPLIYGSLGILVCLMAAIWSITSGNILRLISGILAYGGGAALLVCLILGMFRDTRLVATFFGLIVLLRVLLFDLHISGITNWVRELADLCAVISLCFLPLTVVKVQKKEKSE